MGVGGIRLKPRRIVHKGGTSEGGGGCVPVYLYEQTIGAAYKGAKYRIAGKTYRSQTATEGDRIYFPHLAPSTAIPMGTTILAHPIPSHLIESSNDN